MSTRGIEEIKQSSLGIQQSNISRLWQEADSKFIGRIRGKELQSKTCYVLMFDSIQLSSQQPTAVALGIDLLVFHRQELPNALHHSLLSTNTVEKLFLDNHRKLGRSTHFRADTNHSTLGQDAASDP